MFCASSGISLSWKALVFGRVTSQEHTNVHRTAFFLHTPDFSLSKVTALKVVWGKDTSRRSKEPGSDLPSCFSAWAPFCKCGWRHHISRSGCGPDWSNLDLPHSLVFNVLFSGLNFCVGDIKHIKTTENKPDLECILRTWWTLFCISPQSPPLKLSILTAIWKPYPPFTAVCEETSTVTPDFFPRYLLRTV